MDKASEADRNFPEHVEGTVEAIAQLHAQHYEESGSVQRLIDRAIQRLGSPGFVIFVTLFILGWVGFNLLVAAMGGEPWDPPPFQWLQGGVALGALYMTLMILATQRREDQLASRREQLTLELSMLSERKTAKVIELLEELRRDLPMLENRIDHEAVAMAVPANPQAVSHALGKRSADLSDAIRSK